VPGKGREKANLGAKLKKGSRKNLKLVQKMENPRPWPPQGRQKVEYIGKTQRTRGRCNAERRLVGLECPKKVKGRTKDPRLGKKEPAKTAKGERLVCTPKQFQTISQTAPTLKERASGVLYQKKTGILGVFGKTRNIVKQILVLEKKRKRGQKKPRSTRRLGGGKK